MREQQVVDVLQREGPLSRADIARRCNISKPTAAQLVRRLLVAGLIQEAGQTSEGLGRPGQLLRFDPLAGAVIGLDLGGTTTRGVITDLEGTTLATIRKPTPNGGAEAIARFLGELLTELATHPAAPGKVIHVAIGTPGVVDRSARRIAIAPNVPALEEPGFLDLLEAAVQTPLTVLNDVKAATLGELRSMAESHQAPPSNLVYIGIGTGLGFGLVIGGSVHLGSGGRAGEFGLIPYPPGSATTLEGVLSGAAMHRMHQRVGGSGQPEDVFAEAAQQHAAGVAVLDMFLDALAWAVVSVTTLLDPERVVLGGGLGLRCGPYLERIRDSVTQQCGFVPNLAITELGDDAGLLGTVAVALDAARAVAPWLKGGNRAHP